MDVQLLKRKLQTVGKWYFASFIGAVVDNYSMLQDSIMKQRFIEKMHERADGGEISIASTRTKVDTMLAIVRENAVIEALELIVNDTNPNKVPKGTIDCAVTMIRKIHSGEIVLPNL